MVLKLFVGFNEGKMYDCRTEWECAKKTEMASVEPMLALQYMKTRYENILCSCVSFIHNFAVQCVHLM